MGSRTQRSNCEKVEIYCRVKQYWLKIHGDWNIIETVQFIV